MYQEIWIPTETVSHGVAVDATYIYWTDESDRLYRLARVPAHANRVFEDPDEAAVRNLAAPGPECDRPSDSS